MSAACDNLAGRRVLVTGADGFLGRHLCRRLSQIGAEVHGLGRSAQPAGAEVHCWHQIDCADVAAVRSALRDVNPDTIFHLAAHADGRRELELVLPTLHGDLVTTVNVLTTATERGCQRIVLAGSLEEPAADDPSPTASSPYAAAKWAAAIYARMFHELYHTPVVIGRVFMTYGPGQRDQKIIPYVIRSLLGGERPQLASPDRHVDWIYVDDTVDGLIALAVATGIEGKSLDLGSGELVTIRQIAQQVARQVSALTGDDLEPKFGTLPPRVLERVACADTAVTFALTGWRPQISLESGLARTILGYQVGVQASVCDPAEQDSLKAGLQPGKNA